MLHIGIWDLWYETEREAAPAHVLHNTLLHFRNQLLVESIPAEHTLITGT